VQTKIQYADIHVVSFASFTPHTSSDVSTSHVYSEDTYKPDNAPLQDTSECGLKEIKISDKFFITTNESDNQQPPLHRTIRAEIDTAADATVSPELLLIHKYRSYDESFPCPI
jgi:hypothetical protein